MYAIESKLRGLLLLSTAAGHAGRVADPGATAVECGHILTLLVAAHTHINTTGSGQAPA
jgi:hypothetical protein